MNYYDSLNTLIDTIEKNLETEIDYNELAKVIGTSSYTMQRIFAFLTGITITEYIRKRRLSKAAEELRRTDKKIIDIAMKYQYDSPISFSNAFKKIYGQSPANFRKTNHEVIFFPRIEFNPDIKGRKELKYRIAEREEQIFYGKKTGLIGEYDSKAIQDLYAEAIKDGSMEFIKNNSDGNKLYYGLFVPLYKKNEYMKKGEYYILGKTPREDFVEVKLPKSKWACFRLPNHEQSDIMKLSHCIYDKWLSSSEYYWISRYPELEIYYEDYCEICIAVE
ncbi:MAG: AraC family transcriptional regulator [Clostridia bacterium]|nr:AraC family transcriptional regulator [Clostridia bacterium]